MSVAAVIVTVSVGNGAKATVQKMLVRPEMRTVHLVAMPRRAAQRRGFDRMRPEDYLNTSDYYAIRGSIENLSAATPRLFAGNAVAVANGLRSDAVLEGVDVDGFKTASHPILWGTVFNHRDVITSAAVSVVSESLAQALSIGRHPLPVTIRVNSLSLSVVGVVADLDNQSTIDLHVYLPFTSVLLRFAPNTPVIVNAQASDIAHVKSVQNSINDLMETRRSRRKADFQTSSPFDAVKAYSASMSTIAYLLAAVATLALIIGGVGIMNIMLISVSERTYEIGVRMALGARVRDIHRQFLTEATALSLLGGGTGIVLGWLVSRIVTYLNQWPTIVTIESVLFAICISIATGIIFGYYPARRASDLAPADALRGTS
ncbi:MAG: ABC transporter permease [Gammaproteobacteria bacterium]